MVRLDDDTHSWAVVFIPGYICLAFAFCGSLFVFLENADGVEEYVFGICVSLCAVAPVRTKVLILMITFVDSSTFANRIALFFYCIC